MKPDFFLEEHPLLLLKPRLAPPYGWAGHIPFAYLAIELLRPRTLVELGTHSGNSYMAFCQAVQALELDCRCTAIDTWQGDAHALHYGEQVYQALRARHDPLYGDFSRLLRARFDEAVEQFPDGSVDLLHIDGLHTYDAVRHDFETWLPKLSERAVVLLHDTQEHERDFGVWRFFDELTMRYPCFAFEHSHGLGVVASGVQMPSPFAAFMRRAADAPQAVRGFFSALASKLVDADGHPVEGMLAEAQPLSCHLFYRRHDENYDESRMLSLAVDAADGVLDLQFSLPAGAVPDYLRIDPSDHPGVYGLSRVAWRRHVDDEWRELNGLPGRLGHVHGELLPAQAVWGVRLASFDDDPHLEFEIGSVLPQGCDDECLDVAIRIEYEVVIDDPPIHRLLERQSESLREMVHLSRERIDLQNLSRELAGQQEQLQHLMLGFSHQREQLQSLASSFAQQQVRLTEALSVKGELEALAMRSEQQQTEVQLALGRLQQGVDLLAARGFVVWMRRLLGRRR